MRTPPAKPAVLMNPVHSSGTGSYGTPLANGINFSACCPASSPRFAGGNCWSNSASPAEVRSTEKGTGCKQGDDVHVRALDSKAIKAVRPGSLNRLSGVTPGISRVPITLNLCLALKWWSMRTLYCSRSTSGPFPFVKSKPSTRRRSHIPRVQTIAGGEFIRRRHSPQRFLYVGAVVDGRAKRVTAKAPAVRNRGAVESAIAE